ncbi:Neuropilin-1 [Holothuria leucospilota]|uniref:Neuropilin-1 n=1 Tax=Holothuria leucospilota TaxID=206669 RepID=A0A9Q1BY78_HOLLE|nr:Neuropilin-1 [Holothuria leucospilota]
MAACQRLKTAVVACFVVIICSFGVVEVGASQCENATAEGWISVGGSNIYCAFLTEQIFLACSDALGVADPSIISDAQINASSSLSTKYSGSHVRLDDSDGWIAGVSDNNQYVVFDMAALPRVTGITLQGSPSGSDRVLTFVVKKSFDGVEYLSYKEGGTLVTFNGPSPGGSVSYEFQEPFSSRYVQVTPKSWDTSITMRLELYGCYEATKDSKADIISSRTSSGWYVFNSVFRYYYEKFGTTGTVVSGKVTVDSMTASSESTGTNAAAYGDYKRYSNAGCWIATATSNQWLQADLGIHKMVTKIEVKGASANNAVETYHVYYSSDGVNFTPYQFRGQTVLINGPEAGSGTSLELESFASVLITQYIRIYPQSWTGTYPAVTVRFYGTSIVAADCDTWYSEGFTDPGYYQIEKNNEEFVAYCPFGVSQDYNSCQSYFDAGYSVTGYYQLDPDGSGGQGTFEVYCDFDTIISGAILTYVSLSCSFPLFLFTTDYFLPAFCYGLWSQVKPITAKDHRRTRLKFNNLMIIYNLLISLKFTIIN